MNDRRQIKIALAGNPNSGKTSIFNGLTGAHQKVANFPGVTVEKRVGYRKYGNYDIMFVDLPGTYSLTAYSLDEKVARDYIINMNPDLIINVIDSGNLQRSLYLTMQLIEMGVDIILDMNMWDEVMENGIEIDTDKLSKLLGAPVVKTIGSRSQGIDRLLKTSVALIENGHTDQDEVETESEARTEKETKEETPSSEKGRRRRRRSMHDYHRHMHHRHPPVSYGPKLDDVVKTLSEEVDHSCHGCRGCGNPRWLAIKLLEGDQEIKKRCIPSEKENIALTTRLEESVEHIKTTTNEDPEMVITEGRYGYVAGIVREVMKQPPRDRMQFSEHIDQLVTHRLLGYPIFLAIMWLIFQTTFKLGTYPMEWIDAGVVMLQGALASIMPAGAISDLIIQGVIGGIGSVIIFLPNIVLLFLGISILEDSGYMARAAFIMDKLMHFLGLHGKSFIPMLMGFGCGVPAIMSTRTLESPRDRILTILIIPLMSCSARLPVYILFTGAFFGAAAGNVIFAIYIIGILIAVLAARLMRKTILKGDSLPFVMELPPYRQPTIKSVAIHMWERTKIYLRKMGGIILIASIILWVLGYFPKKSEYSIDYETQIEQYRFLESEYSEQKIAELEAARATEDLDYSVIGRMGGIVEPIVSPLGFNWQMGVSLITGFVAKEVVVSSLGVLYQIGEEHDEQSETLIGVLRDPVNGISKLGAFAFMIFVLLYTPCVAVIVAIKREAGWKWMWFSIVFQTTLAWVVSFIVYQGGHLFGL
ncbi:MAG: ferrous iron transport protein B [Candidatus Zixiibacteriota bacterium]|nr:MAG: ferrous iron transport protein B [candidate division Zixibacteria bacterium]